MFDKSVLKKAKLLIAATLISAALSSLSLALIPFVTGNGKTEHAYIAYIIAAIFWIGLIVMLVSVWLTKKKLYPHRRKLIAGGLIRKHQRIGIINFSSEWGRIVLYSITVLGVILCVGDIIFTFVPQKVMFPVISVTILSFAVHCVIDGKYYKAYKLMKENTNNETDR